MSSYSNLIATEFAISKSSYTNQTPLSHIVCPNYQEVAYRNVSNRRSHYNHIAASANHLQHLPCWRSSKPK